MQFVVLDRFKNWPTSAPADTGQLIVTLHRNTWNDYGFLTLFEATLLNGPNAVSTKLGHVKIMRRGQTTEERTYSLLPTAFTDLDDEFCSLGQDLAFYECLCSVGTDVATTYANSLNDVAFHSQLRSSFENEDAFRVSLLRTSDALEAMEKAAALFGRAEAEKIDFFEVRTQFPGALDEHRLQFDFRPYQGLPHRMSVLVGLNGVGKTALMARLAFLITRFESDAKQQERTAAGETFESLGIIKPRPSLYTVIAVSFSAFDDFELPKVGEVDRYRYVYCGLRKLTGGFRSEAEISSRVITLVGRMSDQQKAYLMHVMPLVLHRDDCADFIDQPTRNRNFYRALSAGQRIVLNIICELILSVGERSLILLDEPETHLHPQLLSTLLAVVGDVLKATNSFAIVATHSPIVVQQVPSRSVHVIRRVMDRPIILHPRIECFGENLTEIVRTVFDAAESDRDYEQVIDELLEANNNQASAVEELFDGMMGLNARLYLQSKVAD